MSLFLDAMRKSSREAKQASDDSVTGRDGNGGVPDRPESDRPEREPEHQPAGESVGRPYKGQIVDVDDVLGVGLESSQHPLSGLPANVVREPALPELSLPEPCEDFRDEAPIEFSHQSNEVQLSSDSHHHPTGLEVSALEVQISDVHTDSINPTQAGDLQNHQKTPMPQRTRSGEPERSHDHAQVTAAPRWFRFSGLDSLFFVIIAVASLLLFASVFVLLTRNNAYIEREYEFLRKQSEGLEARLAASRERASGRPQGEGLLAQSDATDVTAVDSLNNRALQKSATPESELKSESTAPEKSQPIEKAASDSALNTGEAALDTASSASGLQEEQVGTAQVMELAQVPIAGSGTEGVGAGSSSALENSRVVMGYQTEIYQLRNEVAGLKSELLIQSSKIERLLGENQRLNRVSAPALSFGFTAPSPDQNWSALNLATSDKSIPVVTSGESDAGEVTLTPVSKMPHREDPVAPASTAQDEDTDIEVLIGRAYEAYQLGNYSKAASLYNRALQFDPYHRAANLGVAASAQLIGDYKTAETRYRHLLSLDARDVTAFSALLNLSGSVAGSGIESELIIHVERTADPQALYAALGSYYSQSNRWDDAKWAYLNAVNTNQPEADYLFNLAVVLDNLGDAEYAQDYYTKALMTVKSNGKYTFDAVAARARLNALDAR